MESRFSSSTTYSHLLYLSDDDRASFFSGPQSPKPRRESISFFSMTTSRSSSIDSDRTSLSELSAPSTRNSSLQSTTISMPKYVDTHYPLITKLDPSGLMNMYQIPRDHPALQCAKQMAAIHNAFIRALNSSYNHCTQVQPASQRCNDFLKFNQILYTMLEQHHQLEDTFIFPAFERLLGRHGAMEENMNGHETFMDGWREFQRYVFNIRTETCFDGYYFRKLIESFAPSLIQHLHDEIPSILSLHAADPKEVRKIWTQANKISAQTSDLYVEGPFMLGCQDKSFFLDNPPLTFLGIPWIVEAVVKKWHAKRHAGVWEFCPSDLNGVRRMLMV